jgi:hypothetical protein
MDIPPRKVVVGNPAKIVKDVTDEMIKWKTEGTKLYQELPKELKVSLKACEPLRKEDKQQKKQNYDYKPWKQMKH